MRIALDLDNTLFNTPIIEGVLKDLNANINRDDVRHWSMKELPDEIRNEVFKRFVSPKYMCNLKPTKGTRSKLEQWANQGHDLICITSRDTLIEEETVAMVRRIYPMISKTYVVHKTKEKILNETYSSLLIDDGTQYIKDALRIGVRAVLITNKNTPYNWDRNFKGVPEVERISQINLKELFNDKPWHALCDSSCAKYPIVCH